jgi:hypothetical protein
MDESGWMRVDECQGMDESGGVLVDGCDWMDEKGLMRMVEREWLDVSTSLISYHNHNQTTAQVSKNPE